MPDNVLAIGIVGCGAISQSAHIPAALRAKKVRLVAICDTDRTLLARIGDRAAVERRYESYADMLSDKHIHAVVVAVPDPLHISFTSQALRSGKHVLVEKPLGTSSAECREVIRLVDETGLKLQVGCMKRHDPAVLFAKQHIDEKVGRILSFNAIYQDSAFRTAMQQSCLDPVIEGMPRNSGESWKSDRRKYNFVTQGAHLFDMIHFLVGPITAVQAVAAEHGDNFTWHGLLEGKKGPVGNFELTTKVCGDWCERYTVAGEKGNVELDIGLWFYHRPAIVRAFDGCSEQWKQPMGSYSNSFANQLDDFAECIFEDKPTNPDANDGLMAVELLEAVEASIKSGVRVELSGSKL